MGNEVSRQQGAVETSRRTSTTPGKKNKFLRGSVLRKRIQSTSSYDVDFVPPMYPKPDDKFQFIQENLSDNILFENLDEDERRHFINALQEENIKRGVDVVKQGDSVNNFYFIEKGRIASFINGLKKNTYSTGASFGELSLLLGSSPYSATCRAITQVTVWKVEHGTIRNIIGYGERKKRDLILGAFKKISFLALLDDDMLNKVANALTPISCASGKQLIMKGDSCKYFFVIKKGIVKIYDDDDYGTKNDLSSSDSRMLTAGDYFGDEGLLHDDCIISSFNAITMTDCSMLYLSRVDFQEMVGNDFLIKASRREVLMNASIFSNSDLRPWEINSLVCLFEDEQIEKGVQIARVGDFVGNSPEFCIIEEGSVRIIEITGGITKLIKGDFFGENTINLPDEYISERTIEILSPTKLAVLSKASIEAVILSTKRLGKPPPPALQKQRQNERYHLPKITLDDLNQHYILGNDANSFATIRLVTHVEVVPNKQQKTSSSSKITTPYALRIIPKRRMIYENKTKCIIRERNIIESMVHFPFIINLITTFQDSQNVYFLYDYISGGDLFHLIHDSSDDKNIVQIMHDRVVNNRQIINTPSHAMFYASCVLFCIIYLSERSICYRDLTSENVLIDQNGYCVLINFEKAKIVPGKTFTVCGVPEYMAPEVILCKGHNYAADFWSFGVLLYELLAGRTPFYEDKISVKTLIKRIVRARYIFPDELFSPDYYNNDISRGVLFTDESKNLIKQLLVKEPSKRLGCLAMRARGIAKHSFFENMDWRRLYLKDIEPPWIPDMKKQIEIDQLSSSDAVTEAETEYFEDDNFTDEEQALFKQF